MRKYFVILSLVAAGFALPGCKSIRRTEEFPSLESRSGTPERITLKTIGPAGQRFAGTLTIDGSQREISGVTPAEYPIECVVLIGEVTKISGEGNFGFQIARNSGAAYTAMEDSVCRFRYHNGGIEVFMSR